MMSVSPTCCQIRKTFTKKDIFTDEADVEDKANDEPSTNGSAYVHKELCKQKLRSDLH